MSAGLRAKNLQQAIAELGLKPDSPMIEILAKQFEEQKENAPNAPVTAPATKTYKNIQNNLSEAKESISPNAQQAMDYKQRFVYENKAYAEEAAKKLGISSKEVLAHTALESSWGRKQSGDFNLWGIKDPNGKSVATHEQGKNGLVATTASFKNYDSRAEAWQGYTEFLQKKRYASVQGDEGNFYQNLKNSGYATDNLYVSKLKSIESSKAIQNVAMAGGGMAIGAGIARAISNNSSTSIPSLKGVANGAKAVNDVAFKGGSKGFFNSISNGISKITGRDQQSIPSNKADDEKISRELPKGKSDQLRTNVSTESFQQKVLYYLKRIDRNLESGSEGSGKKTLDSNGNVVGGSGSVLGSVFGSLGKGLLGNAGGVAGTAIGSGIGSGIGSLVGGLSSAIIAGMKLALAPALIGLAVGGSIIAHGVNRESDIRTEKDPEKKRQLIQEKNSNWWFRDITGIKKLENMKDNDGKPLISQKTIDTSLPEFASKGWHTVSKNFNDNTNKMFGYGNKNLLTMSSFEMGTALAKVITMAGTSFKTSVESSATRIGNSISNALNGFKNGAATIGQDLKGKRVLERGSMD